MRKQGMGRTRLGRFAAVTIPATVLAAGLGGAMLNGMVGAVLSSADGFQLQSAAITSPNGIKMRVGSADVANGDQATLYAETGAATSANEVHVTTPSVSLPLLSQSAYLTVDSTDTAIDLGSVILNAESIDTPNGASLGSTTIGQAQSEAGFTDTDTTSGTGYTPDGFALVSDSATLPDVTSKSYAITLSSLNLSNLSLGVGLGASPADPAAP